MLCLYMQTRTGYSFTCEHVHARSLHGYTYMLCLHNGTHTCYDFICVLMYALIYMPSMLKVQFLYHILLPMFIPYWACGKQLTASKILTSFILNSQPKYSHHFRWRKVIGKGLAYGLILCCFSYQHKMPNNLRWMALESPGTLSFQRRSCWLRTVQGQHLIP